MTFMLIPKVEELPREQQLGIDVGFRAHVILDEQATVAVRSLFELRDHFLERGAGRLRRRGIAHRGSLRGQGAQRTALLEILQPLHDPIRRNHQGKCRCNASIDPAKHLAIQADHRAATFIAT